MVLLIVGTAASLTYQSLSKTLPFLAKQTEENLQIQTEKSAFEVSYQLDAWSDLMAVTIQSLDILNLKNRDEQLERLLNASKDLQAIYIFDPKVQNDSKKLLFLANTYSTKSTEFQPKSKEIERAIFNYYNDQLKKNERTSKEVASILDKTGLPLGLLAVKFNVKSSSQTLWVVVSFTLDKLNQKLPRSIATRSMILDAQGRAFLSTETTTKVDNRKLQTNILLNRHISGYLGEFNAADGQTFFSSFAKIQRYSNLSVVVQRDALQSKLIIKKTIFHSVIWGLLFVMIALFMADLMSRHLTKGLGKITDATQHIARGDFDFKIAVDSQDELGAVGQAFNLMTRHVQGLLKDQVEKMRFAKELETAKVVQSTLFPKGDINTPYLDVSGFYQPASECGGDLWGHFEIKPGCEVLFIADAMGHGAPAALMTALAYAVNKTLAELLQDEGKKSWGPSQILTLLNNVLYRAVAGQMSMTFWIGVFDFHKAKLTFSNAGHNFPFLINSDSNKKTPLSLVLQGSPLGIEEAPVFSEKTISFSANDQFVLFTDGLIECTNPQGVAISRKQLAEKLMTFKDTSASNYKNNIVSDAYHYFSGFPAIDDITLVVASVKKLAEKTSEVEFFEKLAS